MSDIVTPANLRPTAAATYVGLAVPTLAKLRVTGDGAPYSKIGRAVIYAVADLDAWLEANKRKHTAELGDHHA